MRAKAALLIVLGVVLVVAGAALFVIAHPHAPHVVGAIRSHSASTSSLLDNSYRIGWTRTEYDAALIGSAAAFVVGIVTLVMGLIDYARR